MLKNIEVVHTQTHDQKPLAVIRNLPGLDAEMTPEQMRGLAAALIEAAKDCEQRKRGQRNIKSTVKLYPAINGGGASL